MHAHTAHTVHTAHRSSPFQHQNTTKVTSNAAFSVGIWTQLVCHETHSSVTVTPRKPQERESTLCVCHDTYLSMTLWIAIRWQPDGAEIRENCEGSTNARETRSLTWHMNTRHLACLVHQGRGCSSVIRASDRHAAEAGSIPRCGEGFFSQSQLSVQTLLPCPHSPRVQSHALTSVCELKFPSIGSHTFVWTHDNTAFTASNG